MALNHFFKILILERRFSYCEQILKDNPESIILNALSNNPDIKGIYVSTSKVYLVAKVLEKQLFKKVLIGYDLIDDNIRYLKSGMIDFLIFQNPEYQAGLGISYLIDHLIFKKEIPSIKLLPIEIVTIENHVNYLK